MALLFVTSIFTFSFFFFITYSQEIINKHEECLRPYNCGEVTGIYYPFWGENRPSYCGSNQHFELKCDSNQNTSFRIGSQSFRVLRIDQVANTITLVRTGLAYDNCSSSSSFSNTSLNPSFFRYTSRVRNISIFYDCPESEFSNGTSSITNSFPCEEGGNKRVLYVQNATRKVEECKGVEIEVQVTQELEPDREFDGLNKALSGGFEVHYVYDVQACLRCVISDGACGSNNMSEFLCYCPDGTQALDCYHHSNKWNWKRKLAIGVAAAVVSAIVVAIAFYCYHRRKKKNHVNAVVSSSSLSQGTSSCLSSEDPEKGCKFRGIHFFTYSELEEATNYFDPARVIGDGGFGTVFLGKLRDGRQVAVKRMYESNYRRVEQFMNEVEILTTLHHQNLVSLYGCTSYRSRELLLVYEYVPNGTVADHLHGQRAKPGTFPWHTRMNIAIETASALVYLHASDIIHRDVKTNNILLDNHFSVKVADFGLSRLFPNHVTHISTAPQGTPGYVDPEYHEYYQLTDKSDVYSFGVVLIELISSMPAVDISRHRHEINLSHMAIKKIQNGELHELVDPTLGFESDFKVRKMINAVAELAFQCLQSSKELRPSMVEVLERLMDIRSDGKYKSKPEVMNISEDDVALMKNEPPPPSPDSNLISTYTPPNGSH